MPKPRPIYMNIITLSNIFFGENNKLLKMSINFWDSQTEKNQPKVSIV